MYKQQRVRRPHWPRRLWAVWVILLLSCAGCAQEAVQAPAAPGSGPPWFRAACTWMPRHAWGHDRHPTFGWHKETPRTT